MGRLERELAHRRDVISTLESISDFRFMVLSEGPVRGQVPLSEALDHVPTAVLDQLLAFIKRSAAENLFAITRLDARNLVDWRPGDVVEELRDVDDIAEAFLPKRREYRIQRLASHSLNGDAGSAGRVEAAHLDRKTNDEIAHVADDDLKVVAPPAVPPSVHQFPAHSQTIDGDPAGSGGARQGKSDLIDSAEHRP